MELEEQKIKIRKYIIIGILSILIILFITALFKMVSEGYKKDDAVAFCIVGKTKDVISPCGACRQVMSELLPLDCRIVLANLDGKTKLTSISELLPYSFNEGDLS